jgi:hypothetical protein
MELILLSMQRLKNPLRYGQRTLPERKRTLRRWHNCNVISKGIMLHLYWNYVMNLMVTKTQKKLNDPRFWMMEKSINPVILSVVHHHWSPCSMNREYIIIEKGWFLPVQKCHFRILVGRLRKTRKISDCTPRYSSGIAPTAT